MSCFVGQPPALSAFERQRGALHVVNAQPFPVAVSEIELAQIAVQVRFADVLVHAVHAAFEDREETFDGVGMGVTAHVLIGAVLDGVVRGEVPADGDERRFLIGHELALGRSVAAEYRVQAIGADVRHVEGTSTAVALDQRQNRPHVAGAGVNLGPSLAANIGQVGFESFTFAAHGRADSAVRGLHDLADAVGQEPSGLHAAIEGPLDLPGADPLLAATDQLDGLEPQMQREVAVLENRADADGEGLAAGVALPQARTAALAGQAADGLAVAIAAMRANRAFRPKVGLDIGKSGLFVVEVGGAQNGVGHGKSPMATMLYLAYGVVKCNVAPGMADSTSIEWTDATWNPVTGCTKISAGCDHCYAERFSERFRGTPGHPFETGFDLTLRPERLEQPLRWRSSRMIFVNSMSDLFHKEVPKEFIGRVFDTMEAASWHTFQVLTKRSSLMRDFLRKRYGKQRGPSHMWFGVSVEDGTKTSRIRHLREAPAGVRFLSIEPLIGPVGTLDQNHRKKGKGGCQGKTLWINFTDSFNRVGQWDRRSRGWPVIKR